MHSCFALEELDVAGNYFASHFGSCLLQKIDFYCAPIHV